MRTRGAAALSPIVELLTAEAVFAWVPDELTEDARADVERGRVARPAISTSAVRAVVADARRGRVEVRIEWGVGGPVSICECGARGPGACRHAAALALMLVGDAVPRSARGPRGRQQEEEGDEAPVTLAERELQVRRDRGASELFTVKPHPGTRVYGRYEVQSPSSRSYEVTLRALDEPHNGCTCPDLATNLLGSCKHIEAALHRLRSGARRFSKLVAAGPPASYLHLVFGPEPEVRLRLAADATPAMRRVRARYFRADGRLADGDLTAAWPELQRACGQVGIEIPREVAAAAERRRDAVAGEQRRRAIEAEVRAAGREQPGFRATLYPYQVEGVAFLVSRGRALLADEMGLGKTAQAIAALVRLGRTHDVRRTLIVCPASLKRQWEREIERFAGLGSDRVKVVNGPREVRLRAYADPHEVLIVSYEMARIDERELVALAPDLLILDEAQRIKNWRTRTADAVKRIPSRYAFVLTGTPLENRLDDLYSLMQVIDPHLFGPLWRFNDEFVDRDEHGKVTGYRNLDQLRRRVSGVMLRRRKEEVLLDLPERLVSRLTVPMTPAQVGIHDDAEQQVSMLIARLKKRPLTPSEEKRLLSAFQRMRMVCDAVGLVDKETEGSPKLDELAGLLDEICVQGGHKVVIFTEWEKMQRMAAAVCERLGVGHVRLHGGVPSDARGRLIDRFFAEPACQVFLSTDAGGVGLNLQAASHVVNLDLPWNPAVLAQRVARVHRLGQKGAVNVVLLVSEGSFEEKLETTLDAKRALFAAAVGDDETTTEVSRSTLASRIATMMGADFAATTGAPRGEEPAPTEEPGLEAPVPANDVDLLRARLGDALERIVRLPDGRLLGVIRGDAAPPVDVSAVLLPAGAADALAPLGDASPLSQAEVLYRAEPVAAPDPLAAARRARLASGERKLAAAAALVTAGLAGEALGMLRDALALGCRAALDAGDPGDDPAGLLAAVYGTLIPSGALTPADAHALVRAGELSRAFGGSAASPPEPLVTELTREARDLLGRVRERLAGGLPAEAAS